MKKLNFGNINAGLSTIKELANENAGIARDELIDVSLIDFANKNTYAANDTDDSIRDLADQIETVGLLNAHQTKRVAKVGESVSAGDLIGYVGSTGDSTGNHLHFEIRYNDNRLDPLQFFE